MLWPAHCGGASWIDFPITAAEFLPQLSDDTLGMYFMACPLAQFVMMIGVLSCECDCFATRSNITAISMANQFRATVAAIDIARDSSNRVHPTVVAEGTDGRAP